MWKPSPRDWNRSAKVYIVILIVLLLALVLGPHWWVQSILKKYQTPRDDFPGTGGELATHLVTELKLTGVQVKLTDQGDHYSPVDRTVGLSPEVFSGRSLTAVVVAAHEVGHALQHADGYKPLQLRSRMVGFAAFSEKIAVGVLIALPLLTVVSRSPLIARLMFVAVALGFLCSILTHLVTLPVEFNASFKRALPVLFNGGYLAEADHGPAKRILLAAAMTYVSASLIAILNFSRWWLILRR